MRSWINFGLTMLVSIELGSGFSAQSPPEPIREESRTTSLTRAQQCRHLLTVPDESTWNPTTNEYTTDPKWAICMGVERR